MATLAAFHSPSLNYGRPRPPVCARNSILVACSNSCSTSRSRGSPNALHRAGRAFKEPGDCTAAHQPQRSTFIPTGRTRVACHSSVNASKQYTALSVRSDSSASTHGVLTADFKAGALQLLAKAASLAFGEQQAGPIRTVTDTAAVVTVSEQHLMQALLQQPQLLQLLGQYMAVNRGAAAEQATQAIQEKLRYMHKGDHNGAELQPTDGLLHALSAALGISRSLGLPEVSGYALLWGLMDADDGHSAHENLLGVKLYSADLSHQLKQIMVEAAPKDASTASSDPPILQAELKPAMTLDKSVPAASAQQQDTDSVSSGSSSQCASILDAVLYQALADAETQLQEKKPDEVLLTLCAAITSAADSGFQPDNSWMQKAWEVVDNARQLKPAYLLTKEQVAVVLHAAYASVVTLQHTGPALSSTFESLYRSHVWEHRELLECRALCYALSCLTSWPSKAELEAAEAAIQYAVDTGNARLLVSALPDLVGSFEGAREQQHLAHLGDAAVRRLCATQEMIAKCSRNDAAWRTVAVWAAASLMPSAGSGPSPVWSTAASGLARLLVGRNGSALTIPSDDFTLVFARLAECAPTAHLAEKSSLYTLLLERMGHQPLLQVAQLAEAALDRCVHHLSPLQLANVVVAAAPALSVMSAPQLELYLAALVRLQQHESSLYREQQSELCVLHSELETAVMSTLLSVMEAAGTAAADKEAEAAIAGVLASMKELRIPVTADALLQFNQLLPKLKLGAKPGQLVSVLDFLAHQQMHSKKRVGIYLASSVSAASDVHK